MAKASFNEPNPIPNITGWHDRPALDNIECKNLENVLEEDDKNSIQIYLRFRPNSNDEQTDRNFKIIDSKTVNVKAPQDSIVSKSHRSGNCDETRFVFSQVFEEDTSQRVLFNSCVLNPVHKFINTKSCLLFSYGTTNAGKTYTIHGTRREPGIIPRVLSILFKSIKNKQCEEYQGLKFRPEFGNSVKELDDAEIKEQILMKEKILNCSNDASGADLFQSAVTHMTENSYANTSAAPSEFSQMEEFIDDEIISVENEGNVCYSVWVSFLEVYNENVYDLLVPPTSDKRMALKIAQDDGKNYFVKGLRNVHVTSGIEAYKVLLVGKNNLQVASTNLNRSSSRSHCVFSIKLIKRENVENPETASLSSFSICDLAGAERLEKTGNVGNRMKETQNINTSLHVLGRCFKTLLENQTRPDKKKEIVPFRESKLTQLFHRQLSGKFHEDVIMIVNVNPSPKLFEETLFVLKASAIAKQIIKRPPLKHKIAKRKSMFSTLVFENKNRDTIPWETIEESHDAKPTTIDLEQLYLDFEQEKQRIREECEVERMQSVTVLDNMIQEMIVEHNQALEETRHLHIREKERRENLYIDCIRNLREEIALLKGEQIGSLASSGYNSEINVNCQSSEDFESQLQEAKKEKMELKSEIVTLKALIKELSDKIIALEKNSEKVVLLEKDLRLSQQNCDKLKKFLDEARIDILENHEEKMQLQQALETALSKTTDVTEENEELNKIIVCKNGTIEALENDIDCKNELIQDFERDIAAKNETVEQLQSENDQLKQEIEHLVVDHDRILNKIETERDKEKAKNTELENKIKKLTGNLEECQKTGSGCEVQNLKCQVEELRRINKEKDEKHEKAVCDLVSKLENKTVEVQERSGNKEKLKKSAKKGVAHIYDFESKENQPVFEVKSEPRRRIRTRNQAKTIKEKPLNVRRSKSSEARMLLTVQYPENVCVNKTPSSKSVTSEVEKPLTKSCRKKLYNYHDFVDEDIKPINLNPVILSSPASELKIMKRRLRKQTK